eukprot:RCo033285
MAKSPSPASKARHVEFLERRESWIKDAGPVLVSRPTLRIRSSPVQDGSALHMPRLQFLGDSSVENLLEPSAPSDPQDASFSASASLPLPLPSSPQRLKRSSSAVRFLRASPKGRRPTPRMPMVHLLAGASSSAPGFSPAQELLEPTAPRLPEGVPVGATASLPLPMHASPRDALTRSSSFSRVHSLHNRAPRAELRLSLAEVLSIDAPVGAEEAPPVLRGCCGSPLRAARALQWASPAASK